MTTHHRRNGAFKLTPAEARRCQALSQNQDLAAQRASALLAIHAGQSHAQAAEVSGLSTGQVRYAVTRFRALKLKLFDAPTRRGRSAIEPATRTPSAPPPKALASPESPRTEDASKKIKKAKQAGRSAAKQAMAVKPRSKPAEAESKEKKKAKKKAAKGAGDTKKPKEKPGGKASKKANKAKKAEKTKDAKKSGKKAAKKAKQNKVAGAVSAAPGGEPQLRR